MPPNDADSWHLDKKVPIGIILALVCQTIVLVYVGTTWKVDVESRLTVLEKSADRDAPQEARIIVVEQEMKYIRESLRRIEAAITSQQNNNSVAP